MSVMGFKKSMDGGWAGGVSAIHFFGFLELFNFVKPLSVTRAGPVPVRILYCRHGSLYDK